MGDVLGLPGVALGQAVAQVEQEGGEEVAAEALAVAQQKLAARLGEGQQLGQEPRRRALLGDVVPFWLRHGLDSDHGGYLTALDRDGTVIDTDKSIWFQGRGAWTFATLFNTVERKAQWLDAARSGIEFLRRHGAAPSGKLYFTVTRDGRPLRMRRYVYSESFAAMANAVFAKATGDGRDWGLEPAKLP